MEMVGFYELMAHYRELTNAKGAFKITEKELGVFRELNPLNPQETAVFKLARKRFLEYTSAPKIFQVRDPITFSPESRFESGLERGFERSQDKCCDPRIKLILTELHGNRKT